MLRKIITLCVTAFLILACPLTVFAQDLDLTKTGSVSVTLTEQYEKTPIAGAELSLYYVASVGINTDGNLSYVCTDTFKNSEIDLADPELATRLDAFVSAQDVPCIRVITDSKGQASFQDLPLGLYFIRQSGTVAGFAPCTPFTVTLPGTNADGYVYAVEASPKTEVAKLTSITIKKVWNTNAATGAADEVTVQLLHKGNVVQTATLSAQNDWQVTYTDMPESDAYSIREINIPKGFTATYSKTGYTFTVTNTSTLIQTGQLVWPIPVLAVGGIVFLAAGILLLRKKRTAHG